MRNLADLQAEAVGSGDYQERFWVRMVETESGCWEWQGARLRDGYGQISIKGKLIRTHRLAYELIVGPIAAGLVVDHLCDNPPCANPAHLQATTDRVNVLRGRGITAQQARQTHCKRGHEFTPENIYVQPGKPRNRNCRKCRALGRRAA